MHPYTSLRTASLLLFSAFVITTYGQAIKENKLSILNEKRSGAFQLVSGGKASPVYFDANDAPVVRIAAKAFTEDIRLVTGVTSALDSTTHFNNYPVIIGTIGKSKLVDQLVNGKKLNVSTVKGQWETYCISVIDQPLSEVKQALVIAGSDPRGTAFGVFELSKMIGVSPFYWWADVSPKYRNEIYVTSGRLTSQPPSVKYRGIFINDEDWGLQPWAAKTFEPETRDIGPKTYAQVFELLLRLKANLIWPAMHPSTKAFFHYPGNVTTAEAYQIVIGSSHAEPMLRNNVGEWDEKTMGHFNYLTNKDIIYKYWEDRVKESSGINGIYSLGMRGVHDSGLEGIKDPKEAVPLLERIFEDQRGMLGKYVNKDVIAIPQVLTVYKEVLDIYDNGLKLPEDVTLVWPDDNYGYIQRLNNEKENERSGGSGVYYHASYWGRPHDYLWLSSTHPSLIREEMMKAYENGSSRLWVLNVGDIKPLEYDIQLFMDMAYNTKPFKESSYTKKHLYLWHQEIFGLNSGKQITDILWDYYNLAFERRPEFMGWSQTEPTTQTTYTDYNHFYYGDEAQRRIDKYETLETRVKTLWKQIKPENSAAFYELVYYPVICASWMNKKFLYRDKSYFYARQNRLSAFDYALWSKQAYDSIVKETAYYNNQLAGGKWKNMMSMNPRDLPVYQAPVLPAIVIDKAEEWSLAPEGFMTKDSSLLSNARSIALPPFDAFNRQKYFIDIFLSNDKPINWIATASAHWIRLSKYSGHLTNEEGKKQMRIWVDIDWKKLPIAGNQSGNITFFSEGKKVPVEVNVSNLSPKELSGYKGFIENNGYLSIYSVDFTRRVNKQAKWEVLENLGYAGKAMQVSLFNTKIVTVPYTIQQNNAYLEYDFYTFSSAAPVVHVFSLPTHPLNNNYGMRYALAIDNGPPKVVDFRTYGRSEEWKQNVLRNQALRKVEMPFLNKGKHKLRVYSIDPGVTLDRIVIDLGGFKKAYSMVPETKNLSY